tara:strand:- start:2078 stop:2533 length:456 start_codon:yes stop_codon:yes gene_type:complete
MYLAPVFASEVPRIWHEVRPLVDKALKHGDGEQLSEDVLQKLLNKQIILFAGIEAQELASICIAEVIVYPRKKVLHIPIAATKSGRDFELWRDHFSVVEDFGKAMGCTSVSAYTRKGFAKKLKWTHEYLVLTKELCQHTKNVKEITSKETN